MENQVDEIKNRLDLVEIIRGYMKLEKSGANFRGLCPFHKEKTPSFFVSPTRQLWKCFGCSVGGDMFNFVQEIEGVEFKDSLKTLADKAGVQLQSYDPKIRSEKSRLYEICEKSSQFFEKQLGSSSLGEEAKEYLLERGIDSKSVANFRIGFAPDTRGGLSEFLRRQGYSPAEMFKSGVVIQHATGGSYDRFRGRIMFPISDLNGQIIGFGGRIFFGKNQLENSRLAKYINTPQTLLYDKSKVLYGLDRAKMKIRENDSCVIVEGYTDVIMAHKVGDENIISTSGTALTEQQLDIIHRYTENITTCFDMDVAGSGATKRGIDIAQQKGFNIKVITLPEGKDPAEVIQKSSKKWEKAVKNPVSMGDFYFQTALSTYDKSTPEGMKNISSIILPMIRQLPSKIESSYWVQKLAAEFGCNESIIWNDLSLINESSSENSKAQARDARETSANRGRIEKTKKETLYECLLAAVLKEASCLETLKKRELAFFDIGNPYASILANMKKDSRNFTPTNDEKSILDEIQFQEEIFPSFEDDIDPKEEFALCLKSLKELSLRERLIKLQQEMKKDKREKKHLEEFQKLSIELAKL